MKASERENMIDISFLLEQVGKSTSQVLENCNVFSAVLLPDNVPTSDTDLSGNINRLFDARISFNNYFNLVDYIVFSAIGINFIKGNAVECIVSLGKPLNPERYSSEYEVLKLFGQEFQGTFKNGRIQEDSQEGRVYTWKSENILISVISYTDSQITSSVQMSVQIRDIQLHPFGSELKRLYDKAPKIGRVRD